MLYPNTIAILVNNAFKTVQQRVKDKEDICRRADARQRYLTQDFTLWWTVLRCVILEDRYKSHFSYNFLVTEMAFLVLFIIQAVDIYQIKNILIFILFFSNIFLTIFPFSDLIKVQIFYLLKQCWFLNLRRQNTMRNFEY